MEPSCGNLPGLQVSEPWEWMRERKVIVRDELAWLLSGLAVVRLESWREKWRGWMNITGIAS